MYLDSALAGIFTAAVFPIGYIMEEGSMLYNFSGSRLRNRQQHCWQLQGRSVRVSISPPCRFSECALTESDGVLMIGLPDTEVPRDFLGLQGTTPGFSLARCACNHKKQ